MMLNCYSVLTARHHFLLVLIATSSSFVAFVNKDECLSESAACKPYAIVPVEVEGGYSNQTIKNVKLHEVVEGWIHIEMERKRIQLW